MTTPIAIGIFAAAVVGTCYLIAQAVAIADTATLDEADLGDWPHVPSEDGTS